MKKTLKALLVFFIGLIIWSCIMYLLTAFVNAEINPFIWKQTERGACVALTFIYIVFSVLIIIPVVFEED